MSAAKQKIVIIFSHKLTVKIHLNEMSRSFADNFSEFYIHLNCILRTTSSLLYSRLAREKNYE